ncbi:MAG TPA: membrane protein insertion efficiency factor YidD [Patescibacteria group bacterium]
MKKILLFILTFYKRFISGFIVSLFGHSCRFEPTCSEYAYSAISKYGAIKGGKMAVIRIIKCNPMTKPQFDPVQ